MSYKTIQKEAYEANLQLPELGLVIFTFGNVSVVDRKKNVFAIKPRGVPYDELTPEKMIVVDLEGSIVKGKLRPSSDTNTHAVLYQHWPKIGSIVHTHSLYATAWAQANREIPVYGTTHADHQVATIPCAPAMIDELIKTNYETATGFQIIKYMAEKNLSYEEVEMILIGSHAPFTWGTDAKKAVYNSAILESIAEMAYLTEQINPNVKMIKESLIKKHHERKHGPDAYYGQ